MVDTILINPKGDGYLHTQIEGVIHDIDNVKEYNWCGYVIDSLLKAYNTWAQNKDTPFTGPISFLVVSFKFKNLLTLNKYVLNMNFTNDSFHFVAMLY